MNNEHNEYIEKSIQLASQTSQAGKGGPFGACIVKDGEIISVASNSVLEDKDPTAHAEINAIRQACRKLNTYDLSNCELYTTSFPCPMCLSAIIWSGIKVFYYVLEAECAHKLGFRDEMIYDFVRGKDVSLLQMNYIDNNDLRQKCLDLFNQYKSTIY